MWYRVVRTICLFVISLRCKVHFVHVGKCRHYCMGTQLEFIIQSVVRIPHLPPGDNQLVVHCGIVVNLEHGTKHNFVFQL